MLTARNWLFLAAGVLAQAAAIQFLLRPLGPLWTGALLTAGALSTLVVPSGVAVIPSMLRGLRRGFWWPHAAWLLLFLSGLTFRIRDVSSIEENPVDIWAAYRIGLVLCCGLILAAYVAFDQFRFLRSLGQGLVGLFSLHCAVNLLSTVWSVNPAWTLYKSLELSIDVALIAAFLCRAEFSGAYKRLFDLTWALMAALLATVWVGILLWPQRALIRNVGLLGVQIEGVLPSLSSNGVGEVAALVGVVALARLFAGQRSSEQKAAYGLVLAVSLVTLAFSQTRSAAAGFVGGTVAVLVLARRFKLVLLAGVLAALVLTTAAVDLLWQFFLRGQTPELFLSLSGRTGWWSYGWERFMERPLTGYGAYAASRFVVMAELRQGLTSSMHNDYLEVLLGTSVWGLVPLLALLVGVWWVLLRARKPLPPASLDGQLLVEAAGVLAVLTIRSFFTAGLIWHAPLPFLAVIGYAEYLRRRRLWAWGAPG